MTRPRHTAAALLSLLVLAACERGEPRPMDVRAVPLPSPSLPPGLAWAGGVALSVRGEAAFPGLKGLDFDDDAPRAPDFAGVTAKGVWIEGEAVLDPAGRLTGVDQVHATQLQDQGCAPLGLGGAEDVSRVNDDQSLVSFDRGVGFGEAGCLAAAPSPPTDAAFPAGLGRGKLSAVAAAVGADFYLAGAADGRIWRCGYASEAQAGCLLIHGVGGPAGAGYELVSLDHLQGRSDFILLWKGLGPARGAAAVSLFQPPFKGGGGASPLLGRFARGALGEVASVSSQPEAGGRYRFYVAGEDGSRRTLLSALIWTPPGEAEKNPTP